MGSGNDTLRRRKHTLGYQRDIWVIGRRRFTVCFGGEGWYDTVGVGLGKVVIPRLMSLMDITSTVAGRIAMLDSK